ncbi:MAG: sigma-70 family RNA polymerase sigma factor, partial [Gemmatimonadetes bacterium]|nr:sigma-70 family RNA polymerase sigma factor [Gemmatimonadota bacterium]
RWDETDDILQEAAIRFYDALRDVSPESELHLHRLFALQLRRVLFDLARRYAGPYQFAANHETSVEGCDERLRNVPDERQADAPPSLDAWTELHEHAGNLPEPLREVFDLLWYAGLKQDQAARLLGITTRSLQRRWRETRYYLSRRMDGEISD